MLCTEGSTQDWPVQENAPYVHAGRICLLINSHNTCLLPSVQASPCAVSSTVGGIVFSYDE